MDPQTFIFAGPSGSGKGTQVALLKEKLGAISEREQYHFYTGDGVRAFMKNLGETEAADRAQQINHKGGLQPPFIAIWLWADALVRNLTSDQHLIIDGSPRTKTESWALDSALRFYERSAPHIVFIDVRREESKQRLMERGRSDDTEDSVDRRLDWYENHVKPAIDIYREDEYYQFHCINGEQSVEDVHQDVMTSTGVTDTNNE